MNRKSIIAAFVMLTILVLVGIVPPLTAFFLFVVVFIATGYVGNIWNVDQEPNFKKTLKWLFPFIFVFVIQFFLEQFTDGGYKDISKSSLFILLFLLFLRSIVLDKFINAFSLLKKHIIFFLKSLKYISRSTPAILISIGELAILYFLVIRQSSHLPLSGTILAILFWSISGFSRVLLGASIFFIKEEPLENIEIMSKLYGSTRLAFFLVPFYFFVGFEVGWVDIITSIIIFIIFYYTFFTNLYPYFFFTSKARNTVLILKALSPKLKKTKELERETGIDREEVLDILKKLRSRRLTKQEGERWTFGVFFREISE